MPIHRSFLSSRWLVASVLAVVPIAACGEGSDSKEDLASDVNDICGQLRKDTRALDKVKDMKTFAREGRKAVPAIQKAERDLKNVKGSEDLQKEYGDDYSKWLQAFLNTTTAFGAAIASAEQGNATAFRQFATQVDKLDTRADRQARKLGFEECAKG
jgi:hypothetical protein